MRKLHNLIQYKSKRRKLRNQAQDPESILWHHIKNKQLLGFKFRRQHSIGNYIVDFYCPKLKLVIELDGSQHMQDKHIQYDKRRTEFLNSLSIKVLRYSNYDIEYNIHAVIEDIRQHVN